MPQLEGRALPRRTWDLPDPDAIGDDDPVVFELNYKRKGMLGKVEACVEEFTCLAFMPPVAMRFLGMQSNNLAAIGFIGRCLATEEQELRFVELINDRKVAIRGEELGEILEWLVETYSGHPTESLEPSGLGPTPTGASSGDG